MNTIDALKARISPGDPVYFVYRNSQVAGRVVSLGRTCATVHCDRGRQYRVPYGRVEPRGPARDYSAVEDRAIGRCRELMQLHGLSAAGWMAKLDESRSRAGACHYTKKWILLSRLYVRAASAAELDDTILHEIAHALVGPHHHHDAVWRAKARAIGCSGNRCHTVQFSPPRWIVACAAGCFTRTADPAAGAPSAAGAVARSRGAPGTGSRRTNWQAGTSGRRRRRRPFPAGRKRLRRFPMAGLPSRGCSTSRWGDAADVTRQGLYKALFENGDPRLSTLLGVINSLGVRLGILLGS